MRLLQFFSKWGQDWTGRMNGIASLGLLFWATFFPPSVEQGKTVLIMLSALCFVMGSYHIWNKEHQVVLNLTGKTPLEAVDDLTLEFEKIVNWYGGDAKTYPERLNRMIEKTRTELRHHCPNYVHWFNETVEDPYHDMIIPSQPATGRKVEDMQRWASDQKRQQCWQLAFACHEKLRFIAIEIEAKLP